MSKAKAAATVIFKVIDFPSQTDATDETSGIVKEKLEGSIEFIDVWFRYPTRPEQWVLKGLNLKIDANDCVAVVGESGQGKSTLVNLIMRFYDPDFGTILIDGEDIKKYNLRALRQKMGLVMQEPTLFNYSIKENVLYGKVNASNQEIL